MHIQTHAPVLTPKRNAYALAALTAYISTIPVANWLVANIGPVDVGFGYQAPAGVYMVGLALILRDAVQQLLGRRSALYAVATGAAVSYLLADQALALASVAGFVVSELADTLVYTWLRGRRLLVGAVLAASAAGLVLDSVLFLGIAFHSQEFLAGQILAKTYMTLAAVAAIAAYRRSNRLLTT
ncbi:VUT family protein [Streptomyces sp. NPDC005803]|uniref:VUT family protein n=1 Tax=Streptomyces sp. NPDC005803 TaxID=3154297 RepID=UPI0033FC17B4